MVLVGVEWPVLLLLPDWCLFVLFVFFVFKLFKFCKFFKDLGLLTANKDVFDTFGIDDMFLFALFFVLLFTIFVSIIREFSAAVAIWEFILFISFIFLCIFELLSLEIDDELGSLLDIFIYFFENFYKKTF